MKKIFTLIAAALMAVGASAQTEYNLAGIAATAITVTNGTVVAGSPVTVAYTGTESAMMEVTIAGQTGLTLKYKNSSTNSETHRFHTDYYQACVKGVIFEFANCKAGDIITFSAKAKGKTPSVFEAYSNCTADTDNPANVSSTSTPETFKFVVTADGTASFRENSGGFRLASTITIEQPKGPAEPTAATTWNFAVTSEADSLALAALVEEGTWTYTTDGSRFQYNVEVAANKFVDLGEIGFPGGAGIQVGRTSTMEKGKTIRVDVNNRVQLNCSNGQFRIPDLAKDDVVKIRYASGSNTEARTFTVTNGTPATLNATLTSGAADVIEAEVTVTADGDLTLLQSKGINVYAIAINTELPEVPSDEPSDPTGINTVATDAAKANVVKKYVDGKQVVIEKNGKKYNVAGAQIK